MKTLLVLAAVMMRLQPFATALEVQQRKAVLLESQRLLKIKQRPPVFAAPSEASAGVEIAGFCKRLDCTKPPCKPACTKQPCCCWSTYAADQHPEYPSPVTVRSRQKCLYAPEGFAYTPEPGLSYDDGIIDTLQRQGFPSFAGRRLCCLHRKLAAPDDSLRDLWEAVPTTSTTTVASTAPSVPELGEVNSLFTTETFTTSLFEPGDEYENAQMEMAARAHLASADDLLSAAAALNISATSIEEINKELTTNPNLVRSSEHAAQLRSAIHNWAVRRWNNLKKLSAGDASAFGRDEALKILEEVNSVPPAPPPGLTTSS